MSKDQIQHMISYLSSKLQNSTSQSDTICANVQAPSLVSERNFASTSNFVPHISQITGTFLTFKTSHNNMLTSSIPQETGMSHRAWVIDSGASHHVTHDRSLFLEYKPLDHTYVTLPNGLTVQIEGIGFIQLTGALSLHNALFIPAFKFNLLSVSVLTKTLNAEVRFNASTCLIQDLTRELMIGHGNEVTNLYVLDLSSSHYNMSFTGMSTVCASFIADSDTWHRRLGHPSMSKIELLSKVLPINKTTSKERNDHCHVCHLSKQKRLSFKNRNNICEKSI